MSRSALIAVVLAPAACLGGFLAWTGLVFSGDDALLQFYPYAMHLAHAVQSGTSWLVAADVLAGFPLGATMNGGFWNPLHRAVLFLFGGIGGAHMLTVCYVGLAGLAAAGLARSMGLSRRGAVVGSTAYVLSQAALVWLSVLPNIQAVALLPAALWAAQRLGRSRLAGAGLAASIALSWLGAAPQMAALVTVSSLALVLHRAWTERDRILLFRGGAWTLFGIACAAPALLLGMALSPHSARVALTFTEYHADALLPTALLRYVMPTLMLPGIVPAAAVSVGFPALMLALIALRMRWDDRTVRFLAYLGGVALLAALKYSPLTIALHYLPVFRLFRGPGRLVLLTALALSLLAAAGFDALASREERVRIMLRRTRSFLAVLSLLAALAALIQIFAGDAIRNAVFAFFDERIYPRTSGLPLAHYHAALVRYLDAAFASVSLASLPVLAVLLGSFLAFWATWREWRGAGRVLPLWILGTALIGVVPHFVAEPPVSKTLLTEMPPAAGVVADVVRETQGRAHALMPLAEQYRRTVVPGAPRASQVAFLASALAPNVNLLWGIPMADGYDNLMPRHLAQALKAGLSERTTAGPDDIPGGTEASVLAERLPVLRRLGIAALVTASPMTHADLTLRYAGGDPEVRVYALAGSLPILGAPPHVRCGPVAETDIAELFMRTPSEETAVDCSASDPMQDTTPVRVSDARVENGSATARVQAPEGGWVVFRTPLLPGWTATLDGAPADIRLADGVFMAVRVPAGEHMLSFAYAWGDAVSSLLQ